MADIGVKREAELSKKEICRFCLSQQSKLASIYVENTRVKSTASLPLQIMAITSIEVNNDDGMPRFICLDCRLLFEHCYRFKQMCKKAETLLRQYPLTGKWPNTLEKPRAPLMANQSAAFKKEASDSPTHPKKLLNTMSTSNNVIIENVQVLETSALTRKLHNTAAEFATELPIPPPRAAATKRPNSQAYQVKLEQVEELSMDDVHNLIADMAGELEELDKSRPSSTSATTTATISSPGKPKVLNKSSMRLLNKGSSASLEPRLATPQIKHYGDGNVALVTEILDPNEIDSAADPIKNAAPVQTNVFPCSHCERSFPLLQLLDIHMVNHTRTRSFQCPDCDKSFFSKYDLQKHSFIHTGERPFKCSLCDKAFTRRALLHRHERIHTDVPKFICVYCEKPFVSREEMEKHSERHTKKRPFQCATCHKSFAFKQGLERHEIIHSTNLPFPCQYCERSFVTAGKLSRHLTAHAGKRAYPCKYCPKSYLLSHHLSRHLRMHKQAQTTSFVCSICKDTHQTYDSLVDHSAIHANIMQACPLCKASISDFDSVESHMQAHKESDRHACEFCDFIFLSSNQLRKHIEDDHVVDMVPYQNDAGCSIGVDKADLEEEGDMLEELLGDEPLRPTFSKVAPLSNLASSPITIEASPTTVAGSPATVDVSSTSVDASPTSASSPPPAKVRKLHKASKTETNRERKAIKQKVISPDKAKKVSSSKSTSAASQSTESRHASRSRESKDKALKPRDYPKSVSKKIVDQKKTVSKQKHGRPRK